MTLFTLNKQSHALVVFLLRAPPMGHPRMVAGITDMVVQSTLLKVKETIAIAPSFQTLMLPHWTTYVLWCLLCHRPTFEVATYRNLLRLIRRLPLSGNSIV
jgi:hypothetical protein